MFKKAAGILLLLTVAACQTTTTPVQQDSAEVVKFHDKESGNEIKIAESCMHADQHEDQFCFIFRVDETQDKMEVGQRYVSNDITEWMFMDRVVAKFNDDLAEYTILDAAYNDVSRRSTTIGTLEELHLTEIQYSTRASNPLPLTAFLNEQKRRKSMGLASDFTVIVYGNQDAEKAFHGH